MTEQLLKPQSQNEQTLLDRRQDEAQRLLGIDYEFAVDNGLIDMFHMDPVTGDDGFRHLLVGSSTFSDTGGQIPMGFHHEPSPANSEQTFVDREHLQDSNSHTRKEYRENRYEPYLAQTVINGYEKKAKSTMFPKEYDALTTLQAVKQAYDSFEEKTVSDDGYIVGIGKATLLDGKSSMDIRMVLDPSTRKIITAYPRNVRNQMKLGHHAVDGVVAGTKNQAAIDEHLGLI